MLLPIEALTVFAEGTTLQGEIEVKGPVYLLGRLEGALVSHSAEKIAVGVTGYLVGQIQALGCIEIAGTVFGDIQSASSIYLKSSAKVRGKILAKKIVIEPGAHLDGESYSQCR